MLITEYSLKWPVRYIVMITGKIECDKYKYITAVRWVYSYAVFSKIFLHMFTKNLTIHQSIKNKPDSNKRHLEISSDKDRFNRAKEIYQEALNKSEYNYDLT